MARKLVLVRHGDDPPDDRVVTFAIGAGFEPVMCRPFMGEALPEVSSDIAGSVIYGGPFNVFDEDKYPFLHDEADWIRACMARDIARKVARKIFISSISATLAQPIPQAWLLRRISSARACLR